MAEVCTGVQWQGAVAGRAYIRKLLFRRIYMCISADFASVSAKCTYENRLFHKNIRAQSLPEAFFDENARIKTAFFRFSYVHDCRWPVREKHLYMNLRKPHFYMLAPKAGAAARRKNNTSSHRNISTEKQRNRNQIKIIKNIDTKSPSM